MLIAIVSGMELLRRLGGAADSLTYSQLAWLVAVGALTGLCVLLNPEGPAIIQYVQSVQNDPISQRLVSEWQSPDIRNWTTWRFYAALFVVPLLGMLAPRRPNLTEMVVFAVFGWLAVASQRNILWFALILAPVLARQVSSCLSRGPFGHGPARRSTPHVRRRSLNVVMVGVLFAVTVGLSPWVQPLVRRVPTGSPLIDGQTPVAAADHIARSGLTGHVFHPQKFGDYLIWRLYPVVPVFADGRVHLFGARVWDDYIRIINAANWDTLLARYNVETILLDQTDEGEAHLLRAVRAHPDWEQVYEDRLAVLFRKRSGGE
jgi:hypothetical protein